MTDDELLAALRSAGVDELSRSERESLAGGWLQDAQAEHASVGSFARFTLQLLAIAAPPHLLDAAQVAARDEIQHARFCFALASRLADQPLGPGPLPLDGDLAGDLSPAGVLAATAIEGAVGETLAALRAAEASRLASVPAVVALHRRIEADETRHAELAWQTLAWGLRHAPPARAAVADAFERALTDALQARLPPEQRPQLHLAWGRLTDDELVEVHRRGVEQVLRPAVDALLAATG